MGVVLVGEVAVRVAVDMARADNGGVVVMVRST